MRKQNTKTTVPLDLVPERRTERCTPRFRPGDRFSIRDTSLSTLSIMRTNICISRKEIQLFLPCGITYVPWCSGYLTTSHALLQKHPLKVRSHYRSHCVFHMVHAGLY